SVRTNVFDGLTTVAAGGLVAIATNSVTLVGSTNGVSGTISVTGGTLTIASLTVGAATNATGLVSVAGGTLITTNNGTTVGLYGRGQLLVTNGNFHCRTLTVGRFAGAVGTVTITGASTNSFNSLVLV